MILISFGLFLPIFLLLGKSVFTCLRNLKVQPGNYKIISIGQHRVLIMAVVIMYRHMKKQEKKSRRDTAK